MVTVTVVTVMTVMTVVTVMTVMTVVAVVTLVCPTKLIVEACWQSSFTVHEFYHLVKCSIFGSGFMKTQLRELVRILHFICESHFPDDHDRHCLMKMGKKISLVAKYGPCSFVAT
jgi:hypothetical protein